MQAKESRDSIPWPVAPIPNAPDITEELELDKIVERLDCWSSELEHWLHMWRKRNNTFFRRLPKIEQQIRLLLQHAEEYLPQNIHKTHGCTKQGTLAMYHELLARCLGNYTSHEKFKDAIDEFTIARTLEPWNAHYWHSYVRHLILGGSLCQALDEINTVDARLIESEAESIAQQIVNWALAYPEIGFGIRADIIKLCIALVSRRRSGLLVIGCPLPRASGEKWQRTEILRILWAGMQCSIPIDELCKREGIDEATYYRWRKQFLPPEWGKTPALV